MIQETKCKEGYSNYLKGMYYGILQDCEKGKDFEKLLDNILLELINEFEEKDSIYLNKLYSRTASLKYLKFKYFRETILNVCMPLVDKIFNEE